MRVRFYVFSQDRQILLEKISRKVLTAFFRVCYDVHIRKEDAQASASDTFQGESNAVRISLRKSLSSISSNSNQLGWDYSK